MEAQGPGRLPALPAGPGVLPLLTVFVQRSFVRRKGPLPLVGPWLFLCFYSNIIAPLTPAMKLFDVA